MVHSFVSVKLNSGEIVLTVSLFLPLPCAELGPAELGGIQCHDITIKMTQCQGLRLYSRVFMALAILQGPRQLVLSPKAQMEKQHSLMCD